MTAFDPLRTLRFAASVNAMDMGMRRETRPGQGAILMLAALALTACATNPIHIFRQPERHLGETIRVHGWLVYEFESSNLFPSSDYDEDRASGMCLPIGVMSGEHELDARLSGLNRSYVTVSGAIDRLIPAPTGDEEWVSTRHCGIFGLRVHHVQRSLRSFVPGQE
ncbi:hypothetical protein [Brevundimonas sp.]|uniref:hypothetical protein n=1 Tax=Brevundimonas sp. TaxID=1871086 RepID=UPI002ED77F9F